MAKNVLIIGFEPFGDERVSPSELVVRSMTGRSLAGRSISARVLPLETRTLRNSIALGLSECDPDIVIATMQFGGRAALALERIAVNVVDFKHPDSAGVVRKADIISRTGAGARLSDLPFESIVASWHAGGVPGYISNSAGTFLGNQALYELSALTESAAPPIFVGLVHLPYLPEQAIASGSETMPSVSLDVMKKGLELLIEAVVPWVEHRTPEASVSRAESREMWIPRGVKEANR